MKLIAQVKLLPTPEQTNALERTLLAANKAAQYVSNRAWEMKTFRQFNLHKLTYYEVRERFGLSAQVAVRVIAKVSDAYKLDHAARRKFSGNGSIAFDDRILSWRMSDSTISIWTLAGRQRIPFVCGARQRELLKTRQGETDLSLVRGNFYLSPVCDVDEPTPQEVEGVIGLDMGIVNIVTTSDGEVLSGAEINNIRFRHRRLRSKLQRKGTKSAKRHLRKLSGKESRFAKHTNHVISKRIVVQAQDTRRALAIEDLKGIRERVTARRPQRATLHSWSFYQLRSFLAYKSRLAGIPLILVDPRNTSRTCHSCGCIDKRNRRSQALFLCVSCGFSGHADTLAALEIKRRGEVSVTRPNVSRPTRTSPEMAGTKAALL